MNFLRVLASGLSDTQQGALSSVVSSAYKSFRGVIDIVLPVIIAVVLLFGIIYGIMLGVQFAKAEDTEARDKAKGKLINMVIGVLNALYHAEVPGGPLNNIDI